MTARILIAESSATSRISLKVRLSGACYDVLTAGTADDLLSQLRAGRPDLILFDPPNALEWSAIGQTGESVP